MKFACCLIMVLLEIPQDGFRFVCMTLSGKTLRPGMIILSMLLLTSTLLAEMTYSTFKLANVILYRDPTYEILLF